jgi:hypothetical protein
MHRTALVTVVTAALTTLLLVSLAAAQTGAFAGLSQPLLVTVDQAVPADITLAIPQADGSVVTATAPITVGVNLQIKIDGAHVVAVAVAEADPASVSAAAGELAGELVDGSGIPYTSEAPDILRLEQVESAVNSLDRLEIYGDITNLDDDDLEYVEIIVTLYDQAGAIVGVETTFAKLSVIVPGQTSPFRLQSSIDADEIASYRIQIDND